MIEFLAMVVDWLITALFDTLNWLWSAVKFIVLYVWDLIVGGLGPVVSNAIDALGISDLIADFGTNIGFLAGDLFVVYPEFNTLWTLSQGAFIAVGSWYLIRWALKLIPAISG